MALAGDDLADVSNYRAMYLEHFNLTAQPFSIAPNPRFVYLSAQHREALAHLLYGIQTGGGFVALTGEVGTGKTTLCRCLLEQLPDDVDIALIFNPRLSHRELLATICDELHIANPGPRASNKALIDLLNHHLLETHARGRRTVLLIDEAQNLRHDVLEQVRLLTNLETNEAKLLQIILVGQPELRDMLATSELRQLSQRITARYHLGPLSQTETRAYIEHRLSVSGGRSSIFSATAMSRIHGLSKGIPRLINLICDRSLLGAYALGRIDVTPAVVNKAAREILAQPGKPDWRVRPWLWKASAAILLLATAQQLGGDRWLLERLASPQEQSNHAAATTGAVPKPESPRTETAEPAVVTPVPALTDGVHEIPALIPTVPELAPTTVLVETKESPSASTQTNFSQRLGQGGLDRTSAIRALFAAWEITNWEGEDECQFAKLKGLRCQRIEGDWRQLIRLNHPALLEFNAGEGQTGYATLVGLDKDNPVLILDGQRVTVPVADFDVYWSGVAILLWKPPSGYFGAIEQGKRGPAVAWLRQRLDAKAKPGQEQVADGGLSAHISAFQRQQGIRPDGSAGPLTFLYLNAQRSDGPRLGLKIDSPQN
jgi:general secretion pathway protein A